MKILFAAIGSAGDVYPLIGIAEELQKRGAEIVFVSNYEHRLSVKRAGLEFISGWNTEDRDRFNLSAPNNPDMAKEYLKTMIVKWLGSDSLSILEAAEHKGGAQAIVCNQFCWAARIAAHKLGVPAISCVVAPALFRKNIHLSADEVDLFTGRALSAVRAVYGTGDEVPSWMTGQQALELCHRSDLELLLFDETMLTVGGKTTHYHQEVSWRGTTPQIIGPCWYENSKNDRLGAMIDNLRLGKRLCIITFGDWVHERHRKIIEDACADAVLENREWAVLMLGKSCRAARLERILAMDFFSLHSLGYADLAITHAGIGTCYQLLANQIPAVHIPFCADQYDNALWMRENRGDAIVRYEDVTVENIQTAMNVTLAGLRTEPSSRPPINNSEGVAYYIKKRLEMASVTF